MSSPEDEAARDAAIEQCELPDSLELLAGDQQSRTPADVYICCVCAGKIKKLIKNLDAARGYCSPLPIYDSYNFEHDTCRLQGLVFFVHYAAQACGAMGLMHRLGGGACQKRNVDDFLDRPAQGSDCACEQDAWRRVRHGVKHQVARQQVGPPLPCRACAAYGWR
eukprot:2320123-Rhodomonas_salina.1